MLKPILTAAAAMAIAMTTFTALSAPGQGHGNDGSWQRMLGQGRPFDRDELPPGLRKRYDRLHGRAKRNAEAWLQRFAFPENDGETLRFDADGAVLYVDPVRSRAWRRRGASRRSRRPLSGTCRRDRARRRRRRVSRCTAGRAHRMSSISTSTVTASPTPPGAAARLQPGLTISTVIPRASARPSAAPLPRSGIASPRTSPPSTSM